MANKRKNRASYKDTSKKSYGKAQNKRRNNKRRKPKKKRFTFLKILGLLLLALIIYQYWVNKPEVSINKAVAAIKEGDLGKQEEYFEKLSEINRTLADSYSEDEKEKGDFLKSLYTNLDVKIKSGEKTEKGTIVYVEVSNIDYIQALDSVKKDNPNFHRSYMEALEKESNKKNKKEAKLLLKRRFTGYKIYEDRDFVDGILGGALKYSKEK